MFTDVASEWIFTCCSLESHCLVVLFFSIVLQQGCGFFSSMLLCLFAFSKPFPILVLLQRPSLESLLAYFLCTLMLGKRSAEGPGTVLLLWKGPEQIILPNCFLG